VLPFFSKAVVINLLKRCCALQSGLSINPQMFENSGVQGKDTALVIAKYFSRVVEQLQIIMGTKQNSVLLMEVNTPSKGNDGLRGTPK
jgi:hypothetical protein